MHSNDILKAKHQQICVFAKNTIRRKFKTPHTVKFVRYPNYFDKVIEKCACMEHTAQFVSMSMCVFSKYSDNVLHRIHDKSRRLAHCMYHGIHIFTVSAFC